MAEQYNDKHSTIGGVPEGFDAQLLARAVATGTGPVVHIARDDKRLAATKAALGFFAPKVPVFTFPAWDCLPYDRISPNAEVSAARIAVLATLESGFNRPFILLTTVNAATQRVFSRDTLSSASMVVEVGRQMNEKALRRFFARMGFVQTPTVTEPGDFAIRGGLIDVYPPGDSGPVRLDLFGDVLDGARRFDAATQRTTETLTRLELAPVSEVILDEPSIQRFRQNYRAEFGAAGMNDQLYEAVSAGRKHQGIEHWAPFFHDTMDTLFDYLPNAQIFLDAQTTEARLSRWDNIANQYEARTEALSNRTILDSVYKPCPPELLYLDDAAFMAQIKGRTVNTFCVLPQAPGPNTTDAGGRVGRSFAPERRQENISLFGSFADYIMARQKLGRVIVASLSEGARERCLGMLADNGLSVATQVSTFADMAPGNTLNLAVWPLEQGFTVNGLTVISEQDVLGDRLVRAPRRKRRAENFLTEAQSLSPGDLVVHLDHGIGRYRGLETINAAGVPHDCVLLEYAKGDRLYLPVENIELLSRYGQDEGFLDRLGGAAWQAKKAKLKERILEMADELIRTAAERALRKAEIMEPDPESWDKFCTRFPYVETDDQLSAIDDVLSDMASGTPMERLVCGDVGFGKTEVALRAAFVAASAGSQVAIIAPTTLLVRQHYKTFAERFRGTGISVRQISRFISSREADTTRNGMRDGSVDIVIGTHALLAKDIKFANLGLLVIDEEQHFGVAQKERLKQLRSDIHVLNLTATPIPRTLQMSLSGVWDLSIIGTPPVDRLAIRTYISEFDSVTIREALLREFYRGGQSFLIVPRISDLPDMQDFLESRVPEVSFTSAHGRMAPRELDERMNAFYDGKYDVLLSTTIVGSGLDIPTANTMVIHRADMFGLSQLYQIRGRVGRSKTRAYAYLTTKPRKKMTATAEKRLRILGTLDSLGAGFTLASHDLDIRGAGNLLGDEQSGHVREVGFELYHEMLEDAIARMKAGELEGIPDVDGTWSPKISLGVPVLIPDTFVPDLDVRLGLYRRLSSFSTKIEIEEFAAELIDRFGKLPPELDTLLRVVRIKSMCRQAGIAKLDGGPKGAVIQFHKDKFANPAGLVEYLQNQRGTARVKNNRIIVRRDWSSDQTRIKGAYIIARELARFAKN